MSIEKPKVAIIGLGFGAEFIPIYQRHPNAEIVAICQRNEENLNKVADQYGIAKRFVDYSSSRGSGDRCRTHQHPDPSSRRGNLAGHAQASTRLHRAHGDFRRGLRSHRQAFRGERHEVHDDGDRGLCPEFLYMKELYDKGELGKLQFLKASHQQDMDGWPGYWPGLPPMHYATHCVGPVLGLGRHDAESQAAPKRNDS